MKDFFDLNTNVSYAITFAVQTHNKFNQTREDGITPYYVHILRVIERLIRNGVDDENIIIAAALHDLVEDCNISYEEIQNMFGDVVRAYVEELTIAPGEYKEGNDYFDKLKNASVGGKTIKLADKLDNVWELRVIKYKTYGGINPENYANNAKIVLEACKDGNNRLAHLLENEISILESTLS